MFIYRLFVTHLSYKVITQKDVLNQDLSVLSVTRSGSPSPESHAREINLAISGTECFKNSAIYKSDFRLKYTDLGKSIFRSLKQ